MTDDGGAAAVNTSSSQTLNVSREEIITGTRCTRRREGTENGQGEVCSEEEEEEAVGVKMEALRGSCERANGLAAGRQPERGRPARLCHITHCVTT